LLFNDIEEDGVVEVIGVVEVVEVVGVVIELLDDMGELGGRILFSSRLCHQA
jgi:hypothetical protein